MKAVGTVKKMLRLAGLLLLCLAAGCQYILPREEAAPTPPVVQAQNIEYATVPVTRGDLVNSVQGDAAVASMRTEELSFPVDGRIKDILVKVGDTVKKGDVLMELDTDDLDYRIQVQRLRIEQGELSVKSMQRHGADKTALEMAKIDLEIENLALEQLLKQKVSAVLVSPVDGSVAFLATVDVGGSVGAYTAMARISDPSVRMLRYVDDANRPQFQVGMKVQVRMKSDGGTAVGEVVSTPLERGPADDEQLRNTLFLQVPGTFLDHYRIGDEASIELILAQRKDTLILPSSAIRTYLNRTYVQVLQNGVMVEKDIQVGLTTHTQSEVLEGLTEGDQVILP